MKLAKSNLQYREYCGLICLFAFYSIASMENLVLGIVAAVAWLTWLTIYAKAANFNIKI